MDQIAENEWGVDLRTFSFKVSPNFPPLCSLPFRLAVEMAPSDITAMPRLHHRRLNSEMWGVQEENAG